MRSVPSDLLKNDNDLYPHRPKPHDQGEQKPVVFLSSHIGLRATNHRANFNTQPPGEEAVSNIEFIQY